MEEIRTIKIEIERNSINLSNVLKNFNCYHSIKKDVGFFLKINFVILFFFFNSNNNLVLYSIKQFQQHDK